MTGMGGGIQEEVAVEVTGDGASLMETLDRAERGLFSLKNAVGAASGALAALAVGGMAASISKATELEQRYAEVSTLMDETGDAAVEFQDQMRDLTTEFAVNGGEAETVSGLYQVLSAGFTDTAEATTILRKSLRLAKAGLADTKTSIDVVTSVLNAYGQSADHAEAVTDDLMSTVREGKTTLPELASSIGRIVPVSSELGISFDEVTASIATLTAQGQSTDEAVTAVRQAMVELMKPTKDATRLINDMGYESGRALIKAEGFGGAIQRLRERAEETSTPFSDVFNNVRAMQAVFPLAGQAADTFNENLRTMQQNTGATDEAFGKMADTAQFRFTQAMQSLNSALATTGEDLLPTVTRAAESATDLVQEFNKLNEASDGAAGSLTLAGSAMAGVGGIVARVATGPLGWAAAAVTGLAYVYSTNFADIKDTVDRTMRDVGDILSRALERDTEKTAAELNNQVGLWRQFETAVGSILDEAGVGFANLIDYTVTLTDVLGKLSLAAADVAKGNLDEASRRVENIRGFAGRLMERRNERVSALRAREDTRRKILSGELRGGAIGGRDVTGARSWRDAGPSSTDAAAASRAAADASAQAAEAYRQAVDGGAGGTGAAGGTFTPSADLLGVSRSRYMQLSQNGPIRRDIPQTKADLETWAGRASGALKPGDVGLTPDQFRRLMDGVPLKYQPGGGTATGTGVSATQQFASRVPDAALTFESAVDTFDRAVSRLANSDQEVVVTVNDARFDASVRETVEEERHKQTGRYKRSTGSYGTGL